MLATIPTPLAKMPARRVKLRAPADPTASLPPLEADRLRKLFASFRRASDAFGNARPWEMSDVTFWGLGDRYARAETRLAKFLLAAAGRKPPRPGGSFDFVPVVARVGGVTLVVRAYESVSGAAALMVEEVVSVITA